MFGVWRLPSGALAVLVGDVSGKGLEVAAVSAMVRFFIEARTWDSDHPAQVLAQTNAILRRRLPGQRRARDGVPRRDRRRRRCATRTPGTCRRSSSTCAGDGAEPIELRTTGLPLGVVDDVAFEARELPFGPQHLLFAATDGLLEARRGAELFGQERVTAIVAAHAATLSTQELVERAYAEAEAFAEELTDDVAIIALRPT